MDRRGRCHGNIFVERLCCTVRHEWIYLRPAAIALEQKHSLAGFFDRYNRRHPHQSLGSHTPNEVYIGKAMPTMAEAG
jgi:putative transposase